MQPSNRSPFDIRLPLGDVKFSVRVAILCTRGDTLLTNTEPGIGFHTDSVCFANNPELHRIAGSTSGTRVAPSRVRSD